jgi:hypothetical protein
MEEIYNFSEAKLHLKREREINRRNVEDRESELSVIEDVFKKTYKDSYKANIVKLQK